jgi:hypothetical protein
MESNSKKVEDLEPMGFCMGYFSAVQDQIQNERLLLAPPNVEPDEKPLYCVPSGVTVGQLIKVFLKYASDHPESLHEPRDFIIRMALGEAFPFAGWNRMKDSGSLKTVVPWACQTGSAKRRP